MNTHRPGGLRSLPRSLLQLAKTEVCFRVGLVRPYGRQIGAVLALDAVILVVTGVLYAGFGMRSVAEERGLFSTADSAQLLVAGAFGLFAFLAPVRSRVPGAMHHNFAWGVMGLGLVLLAVDDYATVHERAGRQIAQQLDLLMPFVHNADDVLTLAYGAAGLVLLWHFRRNLRLQSASSTLLGAGMAAAAGMLLLDSGARRGLAVLENPVQLLASALLLLAMLARWQEVRGGSTPRTAADARAAEPGS